MVYVETFTSYPFENKGETYLTIGTFDEFFQDILTENEEDKILFQRIVIECILSEMILLNVTIFDEETILKKIFSEGAYYFDVFYVGELVSKTYIENLHQKMFAFLHWNLFDESRFLDFVGWVENSTEVFLCY